MRFSLLALNVQCYNPNLELATKRFTKLQVKRETRELHFMLLGVQENVKEW